MTMTSAVGSAATHAGPGAGDAASAREGIPLIEQMRNDFQPVVGHKFVPLRADAALERCDRLRSAGRGAEQAALLNVERLRRRGGAWAQDHRNVDGDADHRRCAGAHEQSGFLVEEEGNYQGASLGWKRNLGALERVASGLGNA
jgi:hypothetical protein